MVRHRDRAHRRYHRGGRGRRPVSPTSCSSDSSSEFDVGLGAEMANAFEGLMGSMKDVMAKAEDMGKEVTTEFERKISGIDTSQFQCAEVGNAIPKSLNCGDKQGPQADFTFKLDWRQNPNISLSDWTIVVFDGKESAVYHIHKSEVGHGPRRSKFLAAKFDEDEQADVTDPNTEVYLPSRVAALFPEFLDYVYSDTLQLTTRNVLALKHLANHFDVRALYKKTDDFVESDLNLKTAPTYLSEADLVLDEDVQKKAVQLMAENFGRMDMTVIAQLPAKMFKEVLSSPHLEVESEFLSSKVAQFMRFTDGSAISDEMLFMLTHPQIMPIICPDEAFFFLNWGLKYPQVLDEGADASLRTRCIEAVSRSWMTTLAGPIATLRPDAAKGIRAGNLNPECAFNYSSLLADIKVEIFEASILAAKRDVEKSKSEVVRHF